MDKESLKTAASILKDACPIDFTMGHCSDIQNRKGCIIAQCVLPMTGIHNRWIHNDSGAFRITQWVKDVFGIEYDSDEGIYIFSLHWQDIDDSIEGAIQRIQNVIDEKDITKDANMLRNYKEIFGIS